MPAVADWYQVLVDGGVVLPVVNEADYPAVLECNVTLFPISRVGEDGGVWF